MALDYVSDFAKIRSSFLCSNIYEHHMLTVFLSSLDADETCIPKPLEYDDFIMQFRAFTFYYVTNDPDFMKKLEEMLIPMVKKYVGE